MQVMYPSIGAVITSSYLGRYLLHTRLPINSMAHCLRWARHTHEQGRNKRGAEGRERSRSRRRSVSVMSGRGLRRRRSLGGLEREVDVFEVRALRRQGGECWLGWVELRFSFLCFQVEDQEVRVGDGGYEFSCCRCRLRISLPCMYITNFFLMMNLQSTGLELSLQGSATMHSVLCHSFPCGLLFCHLLNN